jgi:hypothetical protein
MESFNLMLKIFQKFFTLTMVLMVAILITGCSGSSTDKPAGAPSPAGTAASASGALSDDEIKDILLKMADEFSGEAKDINAADSAQAAAAAYRAHIPAWKALTARSKGNSEDQYNKFLAVYVDPNKKKNLLGEEGFKKLSDAQRDNLAAREAADKKFKDDPELQAASKESDDASK